MSEAGTRGGRREGSGRKKGAATVRTREIADELMAGTNRAPLEIMFSAMRLLDFQARTAIEKAGIDPDEFDELEDAEPIEVDEREELIGRAAALAIEAAEMAAKCAQYVHPRLTAVKHEAPTDGAVQFVIMGAPVASSSEEWQAKYGGD